MPSLSVVVPATDGPATLIESTNAIEAALVDSDELIVVDAPSRAGPAVARNAGARRSRRDVIVFVDADVVVHRDALPLIRAAFAADPGLVALFGSYDDAPRPPGSVSAFRNLLHHHIHQSSPGPASTFWTGLGAVRRDAFLELGGFDEELAWIEDIDFGVRLASTGAKIELVPGIQGTHLKAWSLLEMLEADVLHRGAPWIALLLRRDASASVLNLGWRHRLSAAASVACAVGLVTGRRRLTAGGLVALTALNYPFYRLLLRRRGAVEAGLGVGLHVIHHLAGVAAVPIGLLDFLRGKRR